LLFITNIPLSARLRITFSVCLPSLSIQQKVRTSIHTSVPPLGQDRIPPPFWSRAALFPSGTAEKSKNNC